MITQAIIDFLCYIPLMLLNSLDSLGFDIAVPDAFFTGLRSLMNCLAFIFPVAALLPILAFSFSVRFFQIAWAIILRIKSFIPTMGA